MLYSELIENWKTAAADWNARYDNRIFNPHRPAMLSAYEAEYLIRLYQRDTFDAMCSGPDRHERFVVWAVEHWPALSSALERAIFKAVYPAIDAAADGLALRDRRGPNGERQVEVTDGF